MFPTSKAEEESRPLGIAETERVLKSGHRDLNPGLYLISYVTFGKSFNLIGFIFFHLGN